MQDRLQFVKIEIKGCNIWFTLGSKANLTWKELANLNAMINFETFMLKTRIDPQEGVSTATIFLL